MEKASSLDNITSLVTADGLWGSVVLREDHGCAFVVGTILLAICGESIARYGVGLPRLPVRLRREVLDGTLGLMDKARMSARFDEFEDHPVRCPKRDDDADEGPDRLVFGAI